MDELGRFRRGDREAFAAVYRAHAAELRRWVTRFFSSPFEQEEAVQESWLTIHRMCAGYDPQRGPVLPWLRTVAANRCKELLRAKGRRPEAGEELDEALPDPGSGPQEEARSTRVREAVAAFAAKLEPEEARVLELGIVQELPHEEVAKRVGISERRSKYLKKKILARAAVDAGMRAALEELR